MRCGAAQRGGRDIPARIEGYDQGKERYILPYEIGGGYSACIASFSSSFSWLNAIFQSLVYFILLIPGWELFTLGTCLSNCVGRQAVNIYSIMNSQHLWKLFFVVFRTNAMCHFICLHADTLMRMFGEPLSRAVLNFYWASAMKERKGYGCMT